jgi:hypothetical protein
MAGKKTKRQWVRDVKTVSTYPPPACLPKMRQPSPG